jgi:hypothetical protein
MRSRVFKSVLALSLLAVTANAAPSEKAAAKKGPWADADHVIYSPAAGVQWGDSDKACPVNHGVVITSPRVVLLFWGPSFGLGGTDHAYATTLQADRDQLGTTPEYKLVSECGVTPGSLVSTQPDLFDLSTPPANVTDAIVQSKVSSYLASHGGNNASTVYELVIPSTSYSSSGSSTSCGGPSLAYCSYHAWFGGGAGTKYAILPWPGCSGCQVSGWSNVQNAEKIVVHETRDAVTDPTGLGCIDSSGFEIGDKCAWSPTPFIGTGGYSYEYWWGVAACRCVKTL